MAPSGRPPRLSGKEYLVLDLLSGSGQLYGLQLVRQSGRRLKRGTVYVTLQRMEQKGLVESELERLAEPRPGLPRRLYRPTPAGRALLRALDLAASHLAAEGIA